jgi:hypothetical protein
MRLPKAVIINLILQLLLFCNVSLADFQTDCRCISGDPDGMISSERYYKDIGGLRIVQWMRPSWSQAGGCYEDAQKKIAEAAKLADAKVGQIGQKGDITSCLTLPKQVGLNYNLLFGTVYGYVTTKGCPNGGSIFAFTQYKLEISVVCIDANIDSDGDRINDCIDNCPLTFNPNQADSD